MDRYALLMISMSLADAKVTLGFPPDANPSPEEIQKAWRTMAFKVHPDRGGTNERMVEVNVAKDVLDGKQRPTYERPAPSDPDPWAGSGGRPSTPREPAKKQEVTFDQAKAKAGIPGGVTWNFVTEPASGGYSSDEHMRRTVGYVFYGQTDQKHVFLAVENLSKEDYYIGAGPGINVWSMRSFEYPRKEGEVLQPAWLYGNIVKAFKNFQYVEKKFNSKVIPISEDWFFHEKFPHGTAISIKHWLVNSGILSGDDPSVVSRKNVVELTYNAKGFGEAEEVSFTLSINGRDYVLSQSDSKKWVTPNRYRGPVAFVFGDYFYAGSSKTLTRLAPVRKKKIFTWMSQKLTDLPPEAKAIIDAEAAK
jgi:hypothetical protein